MSSSQQDDSRAPGESQLDITLFATNSIYRETVEPIGEEARSRGHTVTYTEDRKANAEIGIYPQHTYEIPEVNAELSVIMFHGLDMGYRSRWPSENWSRFDIGLLPDTVSENTWKEDANHPYAHPTVGVFNVGWPKSDSLFSDEFEEEVEQYRLDNDIEGERIVLYAPTKEGEGKLFDYVDAVSGVADALLIKHAPYEYESELQSLYEQLPDRDDIYTLHWDDQIMHALSVADVVVSDESSVLQEAPLTDTLPVAVMDWPKKPNSNRKRSYGQLPDFAIQCDVDELGGTVDEIFEDYDSRLKTLQEQCLDHYPNLGRSSEVVVDIIEAVVHDESLPVDPLSSPKEIQQTEDTMYEAAQGTVAKQYLRLRYAVTDRLSEKNEQRLKKLKMDKALNKADNIVGYKKFR